MKRIRAIVASGPLSWTRRQRRRGRSWQQPRRQAEQQVRISVLVYLHWARGCGVREVTAVRSLGMQPATVQVWQRRWAEDHLRVRARGRPHENVERELRSSILGVFTLMGPQVGLPTLQGLFPEVPRAALLDLQRRWRRAWRRGRAQLVHTLRCPLCQRA